MTLLHRLFAGIRREPRNTAAIAPLHPFTGPVYAVGDVHGCLSLFRQIETLIEKDADRFANPATLVLLGDMVDRGPQTAALIDHLLAPSRIRRLCLMGNHEAMMLGYLAAPTAQANWLHLGGYQTLTSYGVTMDIGTLERMPERNLLHLIAAHVPDGHLRFLNGLLPGIRVGLYLLAHAGACAASPLAAQPRQALIWGNAGLTAPEGLTLVHGHHVQPRPAIRPLRIGIDTGAYATGHLTALRLLPDQPPALLTTSVDKVFKELALLR